MPGLPSTTPNSASFDPDRPTDGERTPIAAVGASASGLQALETFFDALASDTGMALVVLMHLPPEHESDLSEIIGHHTALSVQTAEEGTVPEPNTVYILPPKKELGIDDGRFRPPDTAQHENQPTVIDAFFRALAADQGENAIGIVLSGPGTDGTQGLRALKAAGGFTMVQDPEEAAHDGMPRSAVQTNFVDVVAPAGQLAAQLTQFWTHPVSESLSEEAEELPEEGEQWVRKILTQVCAETGHDFANYKRSTVLRRIGRRLAVNQVSSLPDYLELLRRDPEEVEALFRELLHCVTRFFRDKEAFEALGQTVLPALFEEKSFDEQVRVWSAGCATGEEAYSLAMLLHEQAERRDPPPEVQIFATDVSEESIEAARQGLYPESVVADLSPERRKRHLVPEGMRGRVREELREMVLFAEHNLLEDPPFSKLDLVSCRDLLSYLSREMQEHVLEVFHYALRPDGVLFLGASEPIGAAEDLFTDLDEQHGLYRRQPSPRDERDVPHFPLRKRLAQTPDIDQRVPAEPQTPQSTGELHRQLLVEEVASIVVNEDYDIVHLTDPAARYLEHQGGAPTHNVLEVAPDPLRTELRGGLYQAFQKNAATEEQRIRTAVNGGPEWVRVCVRPVEDRSFAQILLLPTEPPAPEAEVPPEAESSEHAAQLEEELQRREQSLQVLSKAVEQAKEAVLITEAKPLDEPGPRIVYVNSAFEKQTGYAEGEVLGKTPRILQGAETDRAVLNSLRAALEAEEEWEGETINYRKDGSPYVVQWNLAPVRGTDGSVEYWVSVQRDVTEERRRERALRRQKSLLEQTQRLAGAWEVDLRSGQVSWSDEVYRIHEVAPDTQIEAEDSVEFYAPEARPRVREAFERCVHEREPYALELPLDTAKGNRRWVRTVGAPVEEENGEVVKVAGAIQDITERKQALRQVREERDFVNALLNTIGALVVVMDRDGCIVRFNEECEAVTGYSAEEAEGKSFLDLLVPPDERDQVAEEFTKLKKDDEPRSHENHWQTKDGERRLIRWSNTVLTGDDGDVQYVVGTGIDITERRRLEREVIAASDETRRQIGGDLHDMLASHLAGTAMMADALAVNLGEEHPEAAAEIQRITELIREAGEQARTLSHSLMPLEVKNDELVDGLQKLADRQEQMGEFTCIFEADDSLPSLGGEVASHLYRIASEAVNNAAQHANPETIEIRLHRENDHVVLAAQDDGTGIPRELDPTDGLGLHTMKYRAELIGATLDVGPTDEGGTVVRCRLPLKAFSETDETPEPKATV